MNNRPFKMGPLYAADIVPPPHMLIVEVVLHREKEEDGADSAPLFTADSAPVTTKKKTKVVT